MSDEQPTIHDPHPTWLDRPTSAKRILIALSVLCAAFFFADAVYHKHSHFTAESWFGFYALFSFGVCAVLVILARLLRAVLIKPERYYDTDE